MWNIASHGYHYYYTPFSCYILFPFFVIIHLTMLIIGDMCNHGGTVAEWLNTRTTMRKVAGSAPGLALTGKLPLFTQQ